MVYNKVLGFLLCLCAIPAFMYAEEQGAWHVVQNYQQRTFPSSVPAGNYSGLAHLQDDIYAVVSDKSDSALYFNFQILVNKETGELENVKCLGFSSRINNASSLLEAKRQEERGYDLEAIAKVSDSTVVVSSEGKAFLKEYPVVTLEGKSLASRTSGLWLQKFKASDFYPNYIFESLAYDSREKKLWTISESTMRKDGECSTSENGVANKLRLMAYDWEKPSSHPLCQSYAYLMDEPTIKRKAQTYVMGVSELCVLEDGQLLVLEREAFVPKAKLGAFCNCKLYLVNPSEATCFPMTESFSDTTQYLKKKLLLEWKTTLSLFGRSFANYEGMCLGPKLVNGDQVVILVSDSQDQYAGVLKDWFKTIVISKE